jgi:hypothetical protein
MGSYPNDRVNLFLDDFLSKWGKGLRGASNPVLEWFNSILTSDVVVPSNTCGLIAFVYFLTFKIRAHLSTRGEFVEHFFEICRRGPIWLILKSCQP